MYQDKFSGEFVHNKENYNNKQWEEILLGIEQGLEVSIYAYSYYHASQMKQIRLGLLSGIDITLYNDKLNHSKVMKYIRLAQEEKLPIKQYLHEKLNYKQLEQIYLGLQSRQDVSKYYKVEYNEWKMMEVRLGYDEGYDLSGYLDTHNHNQIHYIRIGLSSGIDIKKYHNEYFKQSQMAEILAGELNGIDTSSYCDYTIPVEEMRVQRAMLEKRKGLNIIKTKDNSIKRKKTI